MDNARDYIENINDPNSAAREWQLTEALIDWVQTRPDVMEKLRQSYQKNGSKINVIKGDHSFYRSSNNTIILNMSDNDAEKEYHLTEAGDLRPAEMRETFCHELEHALQDEAVAPNEPMLEAGEYVGQRYSELMHRKDALYGSIYSRAVDRATGTQLLAEYYKVGDEIKLRKLEYLENNREYRDFIQRYEGPAVMAERQISTELGYSPRIGDYLESGKAALLRHREMLSEVTIAPYAENIGFMLNPQPVEDAACPIAKGALEVINREQMTLKEAGVSPAEDLSGCLLLVPDNTADNKPYRQAVTGHSAKVTKD